MCSHAIRAYVIKGCIHTIHTYGFEIALNILVLNKLVRKRFITPSKDGFESGDD